MEKLSVLAVCPPGLAAVALLRRVRGIDLTVSIERGAIAAAAPRAEVILYSSLAGGTPPFDEIWAHTGPGLRWVHSFEAGVNRLLIPPLVASPVPVTNARGAYAPPLAEFAVLGMLFFAKQVRRDLANQAARRWEQHEVESLEGKVLGVVGYGGVGRACARALHRLGMRVLAVRRNPERSRGEREVERVYAPGELHAMLGRCDALLAAAPLTPETRHLLGAAEFAALKRGAVFINVGRGPVVDERALAAALAAGQLGGAALDVFEQEPLPADSPLWGLDNVLLSPHSTDRTVSPHWTEVGMRCFLDNLRRYRRGQSLATVVDKVAGY